MKQLFALRDLKAESMLDPFVSMNYSTAMRETQIKMNQSKQLDEFAEDFELVHLGTWDHVEGVTAEPHVVLMNLFQLKAKA